MERRRSKEFEQRGQLFSRVGYFGRESVIFLGTRILTEHSAGSTRADRLRRFLRQRHEEELKRFAAEAEASEEHSE